MKEPKDFIDFEVNPELLDRVWEVRREAASKDISEARALAQMLHDIPMTSKTESGDEIVTTNGLLKLGPNLFGDLVRAAISQVVKPLACKTVPVGGDFDVGQACDNVSQFVDGVMDTTGLHPMKEVQVAHACVNPRGGYIFWDVDEDQNLIPRIPHPFETFMDSRRKTVVFKDYLPREQALALWGGKVKSKDADGVEVDYDEAIGNLPHAHPDSIVGVDDDAMWDGEDIVCVIRAFSVTRGKKIGKEFVWIDAKHILEKPFDEKKLPIGTLVWQPGFHGRAFGSPMGRQVAGNATWLKEIWWRIKDSSVAAVPWLENAPDDWKPTDVPHQKVPRGKDGKPVTVTFPPAMHKELVELGGMLVEQAGKATGIDEHATASAPPATVTSGVAIASWVAVRNEALGPQHRQVDQSYKEDGEIICMRGSKLYSSKPAILSARGSDVIRQVKWAELGIGEKQGFQISFEVVSGLSREIPQKIQMLELAHGKGVVTVAEYFASLDFPDWRGRVRQMSGPQNYIDMQVRACLRKDSQLIPPNEMQDENDLRVLMKTAKEKWMECSAMAVPPPKSRLDKLFLLWRTAKARLENRIKPEPLVDPMAAGAPLGADPNAATRAADVASAISTPLPAPAGGLPTDSVGLPDNPATGLPAPIQP